MNETLIQEILLGLVLATLAFFGPKLSKSFLGDRKKN